VSGVYELSSIKRMLASNILTLTPISEKFTTPSAGIVSATRWKVFFGPVYLVKGVNSLYADDDCPFGVTGVVSPPPPPHPVSATKENNAVDIRLRDNLNLNCEMRILDLVRVLHRNCSISSSELDCGGLTPRLTGAGARSAQGTNTGHKNAEGMASVGVRVEPPVRHFCNVMEPVYWVGKIFLFWL
jgi:hypothetical protein